MLYTKKLTRKNEQQSKLQTVWETCSARSCFCHNVIQDITHPWRLMIVWKEAIVTAIHRTATILDACHYRPMNMSNVFFETLE